MSKNTRNRILLTALAALLLVVVAVGGTMAWLVDKTEAVTNTFTTSNVNIDLDESVPANKSAKMVPGSKIAKDPYVTVEVGSEDCYLFVEIVPNSVLGTYITWSTNENWDQLEGATGKNGGTVYYYNKGAVSAPANDEAATKYYILDQGEGAYANGYVTVKNDVVAADMTAADTTAPTLTFYAYACQSANITDTDGDGSVYDEAWTYIGNNGKTSAAN